MQLHRSMLALLMASSLIACGGGNLEGGTTPSEDVPAETPDVPVENPDEIVEEVTGDAAYFSYEGVSSDWITIKGVGAEGTDEVATVSFKILDANRVGISGEVVTFELINPPAGVVLALESATSDEDGVVSTLIKSGYAAGSVTVKTTLVSDTDIYKTSNKLNISTGYPDQDSVTLTVDNFSPEGLNTVEQVGVTIYLGGGEDNTAVPDGTTVNFSTDSGRITDADGISGACTTVGSECTMVWKSTKPHTDTYRATIKAEADGEESFTDSNEDGLYTEGEDYVDTNGDGKYTGMLCFEDTDYCTRSLITVFASTKVTISGSDLACDFTDTMGTPINQIDLTTTTGSDSVTFNVSVYDENNNVPPSTTSISSDIGNGELDGSKTSWTVPNISSNNFNFDVTLMRETDPNDVVNGKARFDITSPNGTYSPCSIVVIDDPAPEE
ncbi:hypothetical protein GCM10007916_17290 [Psychromonas marina]|uniref:Big-1 domain-containing protein n=1 Tax=Psychromonas marina TaxID=88364 RepID=A0ABQ6E017_9GAMM|nr:hypothetical protein [Psychromonas marina]GLS90662.1 hypothetical protein GCM10007916_17290 [Psychromonas marina]